MAIRHIVIAAVATIGFSAAAHAANSVTTVQVGVNNSSSTSQTGISNSALAIQFGLNNGAAVAQSGIFNSSSINQTAPLLFGNNSASVGQGGIGFIPAWSNVSLVVQH